MDLPSLVAEALGAGTRVRLDNRIGDLAQAPDAIGRSAYRMVQESLTNARKHAPDTTVDVMLSGEPGGELLLEVRNPIRVGAVASTTPGSGLGLVGLTERAELIGGRLEHATSGARVRRAGLAAVAGMTDPARAGQVRVVIVDDDALVRAGLAMILRGDPTIEIVGEAADGESGLDLIAQTSPDVVLMDIRMPRLDGLGATARLMGQPAPPKVIVLTTFDADDYVVRALRDGASGFLLKDTPPAQIVDAVHKVAAGDHMLSPSVTAQLIARLGDDEPETARHTRAQSLIETLSTREREVATAVGEGKANAEIAQELYMSVATVKAHVSRIMVKLEAANRVHIAIRVHEAGLV